MIEAAILIVFPFAMAFAGISDLLSMTIQNRVSLILLAAFAVLAPMTGMPWDIYGLHFAAGAVVLAVTFLLFAMGTMGGGDAKLMTATAVWMGWNVELAGYLLFMSLLGGALTLAILKYRSSHFAIAYAGRFNFMHRLAQKNEGVPYGVALGAAGLIMFPSSPLCVWVIDRLAHA
ncbi:A24 family peptidase [Phyllobacterium myrsinacearum]|uniref:Peptidase n=1 Tax=Phyllobacterium myrsinacearum TaxID=28101 RepID=A0A2S9JCN3_9HYPH|nr:prepilin peptidase [Phyllobacterium myrsinacearum]PRD50576.1 peptidase [Phyllobacterium myrsinacearum]PWV94872.1 prepilin peptidase CpaA [Phyllobacterium myrsinacearum]RZS87945.1 prepilin peptidase CpaA [Phyllobacterium myrsinacearum]RZV07017.1 prepilin peptidase CpaA [Phyllobacterium myrsinacearum]